MGLTRIAILNLALMFALGCACPAESSVRAARGLLDLAAPVSTLSPAQAERWGRFAREWRELSVQVVPEEGK